SRGQGLRRNGRTRLRGHRSHGDRVDDSRLLQRLSQDHGPVARRTRTMDVDTMTKPAHPSAKSAVEARALRADIYDFNSAYAACIDDGDIMQWPDFFTEDAIYKVIPRENYDQGLPLATIFA